MTDTPSAEVEALRAERDALLADSRAAIKAHAERAAEVATLRARVAELKAALRAMFEFASIQWRTASDDDKVSMITTRYEDRTREEIFEAARAALTKETPDV